MIEAVPDILRLIAMGGGATFGAGRLMQLMRQVHAIRAFERAAAKGYDTGNLAEIIRATNPARWRT